MAAAEVADGRDQTHPTVTAKLELARIRPAAAVPPVGVCPEPSPIEPGDVIHLRAIATLLSPKEYGRAIFLPGHMIRIQPPGYNLSFITSEEQQRKLRKTLSFTRYCLKLSMDSNAPQN